MYNVKDLVIFYLTSDQKNWKSQLYAMSHDHLLIIKIPDVTYSNIIQIHI